MTTYWIKNAAILGGEPTDIVLANGLVWGIGVRPEAGVHDEVVEVDATGLIALPGLVDRSLKSQLAIVRRHARR